MSWGDSWGNSPGDNAKALAKAFYEGRELRRGKSYVEFHRFEPRIEYHYDGAVIAWYTPASKLIEMIADRLTEGVQSRRWPLQFRCHYGTKAEARHLKALGLEAEWQYDKKPFLLFGVDAIGEGWHTIEEWKATPKWAEPPKLLRPERFVNLTMPLFA
jgi:hypothetical protein